MTNGTRLMLGAGKVQACVSASLIAEPDASGCDRVSPVTDRVSFPGIPDPGPAAAANPVPDIRLSRSLVLSFNTFTERTPTRPHLHIY